jgi:hypothetical protein
MQIVRANPHFSLPLVQEQPRERHANEQAALQVHPSDVESHRATRTIQDIQSAERMLERRQRSETAHAHLQEGRQQRGAAAYQALQQGEERAYVSEVLGIDVYA